MTKNILWTGGWDSTFRVLDLVLIKNKKIQPHYILDHRRYSAEMELKTMEKIKQLIYEKKPAATSLILDTIVTDIRDIPADKEITESYRSLASLSHLGDQYDWLTRYVKHSNVSHLELCIHRDDKATGFLKKEVKKITTNDDYYYVLKEDLSKPELKIFSYYHFPLFDLTKLDMEEIARKNDFRDIMEETWFCYYPTKDGKPCGLCNPCKYTRDEGLGRRVPAVTTYGKIRYNFLRLRNKVKNMLK